MQISTQYYGTTSDGQKVTRYTMRSRNGVTVSCLDYGCIITNIWVNDREGKETDIVLGYDDLAAYEEDTKFFGACVGRVANRIKDSRFTLNGQEYRLKPNNGMNHLHGVFHKKVFTASVVGGSLRFTYHSPDGEDGFPGNVDLTVTYTLDDNGVFAMQYEAISDADTLINITNHSYFNLSGESSGRTILDHTMEINADTFTVVDSECIPTGEMRKVDGTPFDLREGRRIGDGIDADDEQIRFGKGYDHNFNLNDDGLRFAARVTAPDTGRVMNVFTDMPAIQFYAGNMIDCANPGKSGAFYQKRQALCLETQYAPDSVNHPNFPDSVLYAGQKYDFTTIFSFDIDE